MAAHNTSTTPSGPPPTAHTTIRIFYNPPEGATLGVRCGGEGNDWQKFYYGTKKGNYWMCTIPMAKDPQNAPIEFKPVLQYNSPSPVPIPPLRKFSFSSTDLRNSFLSSSSAALFKSQSHFDTTKVKSSPKPPSGISIKAQKEAPKSPNTPNAPNSPKSPKSPNLRELLMSPMRPSAFSLEGEYDETYAVGSNYITTAGSAMDVYPWFYNWHGSIEVLENIESKLGNKRNVIVYLPPSYAENQFKKYPVLVMHDAHNLFYEHLSFAGRIWKIPFTMDELCSAGVIKETIIVSLTPIEREYEYLPPTPDQNASGGGADKYLDFIGKEVKPMIAEKYRITGEYGIAGSSYGGIISLYAWITRPNEYTLCGCYSPSLRWHHNYMFTVMQKAAENFTATHDRHTIYLDAGTESDQLLATTKLARKIEKSFNKDSKAEDTESSTQESSDQSRALEVLNKLTAATGTISGIRSVPAVQTVGAVLTSGKVLFDISNMINVGQGHNHSEDSWAKRTPLAFSYLLADKQREIKWIKEVVDDVSQRTMY